MAAVMATLAMSTEMTITAIQAVLRVDIWMPNLLVLFLIQLVYCPSVET